MGISYTKTQIVQKIRTAIPIVFLLMKGFCFGQISIKTMDSTQNSLADSLVRRLAGFGVSVSQISSNLKPTNKYVGSFRSNHPAFPFTKGIVMSTGFADSAGKPNRNIPISNRIAYTDTVGSCSEGRWLLNTVLRHQSNNGLVQKTTDVSTIRFNLIPEGDSLRFRYLFASEEYAQFVCSQFNDIFGFFIKGPGIQGDSIYNNTPFSGFRNLARLPQNQFPVAINTVNNGQSGPSGSTENCRFSDEGMAFYRNNLSANSGVYGQLAFDGLTHALEAKTAVLACQSYTIILAIGDVGDRIFDSGVFLEQGSMVSGKFEIERSNGQPALGDTLTSCAPIKIRFKRCPNIAEKWVIRFQTSGSAIPNQDFKRRLPGGELIPLGDSLVIAGGQSSDSLILQALGNSEENKTLAIHFQNIEQPWINGQPQFSGLVSQFVVRPKSQITAKEITLCAQSQTIIPISASAWTGFTPFWKEIVNGTAVPSQVLSCNQCPNPTLTGDNQNRTFVVRLQSSTNNCFFEDTLQVQSKPLHPVSIIKTGDSIVVQNISPGYSLAWRINGSLANMLNPEKILISPGSTYDLHIQAPNGCDQWINQVHLQTRINANSTFRTMRVFPNPATHEINILVPEDGICALEWFNSQGKCIRKSRITAQGFQSTTDIPSGCYWIKATSPTGEIYFQRVSIRH